MLKRRTILKIIGGLAFWPLFGFGQKDHTHEQTQTRKGDTKPAKRQDMNVGDVEEKVKKIISDKFGIEPEKVKPEANIVDDFGADSLDLVELIMRMEEAFDIEIPDEDAEKLIFVRDLIDYIVKRKS